jgi:hypothetical protein
MNIALGYIKQIGVSILEHPGQFLILPAGKMAFVYIIPLIVGDWYLRRDERVLEPPKNKKTTFLVYLILMSIIFLLFGAKSNFIYFQF